MPQAQDKNVFLHNFIADFIAVNENSAHFTRLKLEQLLS